MFLPNYQIDEDEDYRGFMKKILKRRTRLAPIRLEFYKYTNSKLTNFLCNKLNLKENQVMISNAPLNMIYVYNLYDHVKNVNELLFHKLSFNPYYPKIENCK